MDTTHTEYRLLFRAPAGDWADVLGVTIAARDEVDEYVRSSPWPWDRYKVESRTVTRGHWINAEDPPKDKVPYLSHPVESDQS